MKRFFIVIFTLILCCNISYAQDKATPSTDAPVASATKKTDIPTVNANAEPSYEKTSENQGSVSQNIPIDERMAKFADEANDFSKYQTIINSVGLFLLFLTTGFAWGAWQAGKDAVGVSKDTLRETQKANERSLRAYVTVDNFEA